MDNQLEAENEYINLHKADQPWQPSFKVNNCPELKASLLVEEKIRRTILSRLNKLTPEKFCILLEQLKNLELDSMSKIKILVDLIYQKAIDEPLYCPIYANMCRQLALITAPGEIKTLNFRKLLLTKCQKEFEYEYQSGSNKEQLKEVNYIGSETISNYEEEKRHRNRVLGNLRLIGELCRLGMVVEPIMHEVLNMLLLKNTDESLEGVCVLLKIVGKELDENGRSKLKIDSYFKEIHKIVENQELCSRIRFMLLDLIDLRQNGWVPRRIEIKPKTLDEIHKEVEQELQILEIC